MPERLVLDLRRSGIPEVPLIGRYSHKEAKRGIDLHAHRGALEICYLAKGRQLYRVGDRDYVLSGGDVFVTYPGERHSTGESPQEKGVLYWIQIVLPRRAPGFLQCGSVEARTLVARLRKLPHRHFAGSPALARLLDEVMTAGQTSADPLQRLLIQNRLVDFLLRILALAASEPRSSVSAPISDLLRYIDANLHQKLPVPDLAQRMGLSVPRFKARFRAEIGIPPAEYVVRCKVATAQRQLAASGATVTEVAMDLGFASSQYFATVFKRLTGRQPSANRAASRREAIS